MFNGKKKNKITKNEIKLGTANSMKRIVAVPTIDAISLDLSFLLYSAKNFFIAISIPRLKSKKMARRLDAKTHTPYRSAPKKRMLSLTSIIVEAK